MYSTGFLEIMQHIASYQLIEILQTIFYYKKNIYQGIIVYTIELLSSTSSMSMLNMDIVLAEWYLGPQCIVYTCTYILSFL